MLPSPSPKGRGDYDFSQREVRPLPNRLGWGALARLKGTALVAVSCMSV